LTFTRKRYLADFAVAGGLLYLSVWVYELANLLSLSVSGHQVSVSFSDLLPIGTGSLSYSSGPDTMAKIVQVTMSSAAGIFALIVTRRFKLTASQLASTSILGIYAASFYWEILPLAAYSGYLIHVITFLGLAGVANIAILYSIVRRKP
jgi:hypothetical protein